MNFVNVTALLSDGHTTKVRLNLDHVTSYGAVIVNGEKRTAVSDVSDNTIYIIEQPEFLDGFISGMAAFKDHVPGSTFEQPESWSKHD